jgi:hypothetical protein
MLFFNYYHFHLEKIITTLEIILEQKIIYLVPSVLYVIEKVSKQIAICLPIIQILAQSEKKPTLVRISGKETVGNLA